MKPPTIEWKEWGTFKDLNDLAEFIQSSNYINYQMFWPTLSCPIVVWLN